MIARAESSGELKKKRKVWKVKTQDGKKNIVFDF